MPSECFEDTLMKNRKEHELSGKKKHELNGVSTYQSYSHPSFHQVG